MPLTDSNVNPWPQDVVHFDPSTKVGAVPTVTGVRRDMHIQREKQTETFVQAALSANPKKKPFYAVYGTQLGVTTFVTALSLGALFWINPPLTQKTRPDPYTQERQDWKWVIVALILVAFLTFVMPDILVGLKVFKIQ
jgi:hypothetical protein